MFPINGRLGGEGGRWKAAIDDFFLLLRACINMNEMERAKAIERSHEGKLVDI